MLFVVITSGYNLSLQNSSSWRNHLVFKCCQIQQMEAQAAIGLIFIFANHADNNQVEKA
jgi:hypothetical protein